MDTHQGRIDMKADLDQLITDAVNGFTPDQVPFDQEAAVGVFINKWLPELP